MPEDPRLSEDLKFTLEDAAQMILSDDRRTRFIGEYWLCRIRYVQLCRDLEDVKTRFMRSFYMDEDDGLCYDLCGGMKTYLDALEGRAELEGINLDGTGWKMIHMKLEQDGKCIADLDCRAICLSYDDGDTINGIVAADPGIPIDGMGRLGCVAASGSLKWMQGMERGADGPADGGPVDGGE